VTVPALRFPVKTTVGEPARIAVVDSWRIDVPDQAWLVDRIVEEASVGQGGTVFTINLDHLAKLRSDAAFHAAYRRATHVSADGMPVVLLARAEGVSLERVTAPIWSSRSVVPPRRPVFRSISSGRDRTCWNAPSPSCAAPCPI